MSRKIFPKFILLNLSLIIETTTSTTTTTTSTPLEIIEVSREVFHPGTSSESLILELQWSNEVRMNVSLSRTLSYAQACRFESVLPFDPESQMKVRGCGSQDDFTLEIISKVYGNHALGVTVGKVPELQNISGYINSKGESLLLFGSRWQRLERCQTLRRRGEWCSEDY